MDVMEKQELGTAPWIGSICNESSHVDSSEMKYYEIGCCEPFISRALQM